MIIGSTKRSGWQNNLQVNPDLLGRDITVIEVDIFELRSSKLPYSMLLNIGLDVVTTDLVCICPLCRDISIIFGVSVVSSTLSAHKMYEKVLQQLKIDNEMSPVAIVVPMYEDVTYHATSMSGGYRSIFSACEDQSSNKTKRELSFSLRDLWLKSSTSGGQKLLKYRDEYGKLREALVKMKKSIYSSSTVVTVREEMIPEHHILMLPTIINRTQSLHGATFLKFPEEIDNVGCFGGLYLSVFSGAGYVLQWPVVFEAENNQVYSVVGSVKRESKLKSVCSCETVTVDAESLNNFFAAVLQYHTRAEKLRVDLLLANRTKLV